MPTPPYLMEILNDYLPDDVLRLQLPNGSTIVGFADGIAIVSVGKTIREIQEMTNIEIRKVGAWKIVEKIEVPVGGTRIESKRAIKYLRVIIDDSLSKEHVKFIGEKDIRNPGRTDEDDTKYWSTKSI